MEYLYFFLLCNIVYNEKRFFKYSNLAKNNLTLRFFMKERYGKERNL